MIEYHGTWQVTKPMIIINPFKNNWSKTVITIEKTSSCYKYIASVNSVSGKATVNHKTQVKRTQRGSRIKYEDIRVIKKDRWHFKSQECKM